LLVYSLSNISAKNYQNPLMRVEVTACYISVVSFQTQRRIFHKIDLLILHRHWRRLDALRVAKEESRLRRAVRRALQAVSRRRSSTAPQTTLEAVNCRREV